MKGMKEREGGGILFNVKASLATTVYCNVWKKWRNEWKLKMKSISLNYPLQMWKEFNKFKCIEFDGNSISQIWGWKRFKMRQDMTSCDLLFLISDTLINIENITTSLWISRSCQYNSFSFVKNLSSEIF